MRWSGFPKPLFCSFTGPLETGVVGCGSFGRVLRKSAKGNPEKLGKRSVSARPMGLANPGQPRLLAISLLSKGIFMSGSAARY